MKLKQRVLFLVTGLVTVLVVTVTGLSVRWVGVPALVVGVALAAAVTRLITREVDRTTGALQAEIDERRRAHEALGRSNDRLRRLHEQLVSTTVQLKKVMLNVVEGNAGPMRFENPDLLRCWEVKGCTHEACPVYGRDDRLRCWEIAGTFCRNKVQGKFAQKLKDCRKCVLYQRVREDPVSELGEMFNDTMAILEDRQRDLAEASERAEAASRAKSEFLANMSHEIRTPMTAILGFADVLLERNDLGKTSPQQREAAETIKRNGAYLLGILNDILDLSKIEAGKMHVERVRCSPCRVVAEVASLVRVSADAKRLSFDIAYVGAVPETIETDPTRLRQILINLLGNAIKFTEVGGVRLLTRFVDDGETPLMQFDVVDTGLGMTAEQVAKLFQPFVQADTSTTRKFGGTGLGLTLSKRFAQMLEGDVTVVETQPGQGTRIRTTVATGRLDGVKMIRKPTSATVIAEDSAAVGVGADPSGLDGIRILLAEDGPDNQRLISFLLKKAGAEVTLAENGRVAVDKVLAARDAGTPFEIILMDMQMPRLDGYEATRLLRREGHTGPIIALTAHAMAGDREKCLRAGCDDYATKPIDRKKLIETIQCHRPAGVASV